MDSKIIILLLLLVALIVGMINIDLIAITREFMVSSGG